MSSSKHEKMGCTKASSLPVDFIYDFKDVVLSHMDELLSLLYMDRKLQMFNFHHNLSYNKIPYIMLHMVQRLHGGLVWQICSDQS